MILIAGAFVRCKKSEPGRLGNMHVATLAPQRDAGSNLVDKLVFLNTVLSPFRVEDQLTVLASLPWLRDGDKI